MANPADPWNYQKYGVPFYGAGWVPYKHIRSDVLEPPEKEEKASSDDNPSSEPVKPAAPQDYVVLTGGGGEGRSGIPNAIVLAHFDFESYALSDQPVFKLGLNADLPYRTAIHPGKDGIICAFENSCRLYEWDEVDSSEIHKLGLKESGKVLTELENIGQQLALSFNNEGTVFAVGGEDGSLRVFKWPSMDIMFNEDKAHSSIKDLTFSPDGKFLASLGKGSPIRIWDLSKSTTISSLAKEKDEMFAFCRFSQISDNKQFLHVAAVTDRGSTIITWDTTSWKRMSSKQITRDSVAAFNVSADGKLLAVGTSQGDILMVSLPNWRVHMMVKKAHLGFVTALMFSHDSRALLSASMDSSARVTLIEDKKQAGGLNLWMVLFFMILAIAVYIMRSNTFPFKP